MNPSHELFSSNYLNCRAASGQSLGLTVFSGHLSWDATVGAATAFRLVSVSAFASSAVATIPPLMFVHPSRCQRSNSRARLIGPGLSRMMGPRGSLCKPVHSCSSGDRKSTRLNSSHGYISYAVFCLKKKKKKQTSDTQSE